MRPFRAILFAILGLTLATSQARSQAPAAGASQRLRVKGIKSALGKMDAASKDKTRAAGESFEVEETDLAEGAQLEKSKARQCFYCGTVMMEVMGKSVYNPGKADSPKAKKRVTAYFKRLRRSFRSIGIETAAQPDLDEVVAAFEQGDVDALGAALEKLSGTVQDNLEVALGPDAIWYYGLGYAAKGYKLAGQARLYDMVSLIAPTPEDLLSYTPEKVDQRVTTALGELQPVSQKNEDEIGPRDYVLLKSKSTVILNAFRKARPK